MNGLAAPEHLLLLVLAVALGTMVSMTLLWELAMRLWVRCVIWKTMRVSADVGAHITDLLRSAQHEDALVVILKRITDETYLLTMRALRHAEQAQGAGEPGAAQLVAQLQRYLTDHATCPLLVFHGFAIPEASLLAVRYPRETSEHNARTVMLRKHFRWASDWLWRYRFNTPRP